MPHSNCVETASESPRVNSTINHEDNICHSQRCEAMEIESSTNAIPADIYRCLTVPSTQAFTNTDILKSLTWTNHKQYRKNLQIQFLNMFKCLEEAKNHYTADNILSSIEHFGWLKAHILKEIKYDRYRLTSKNKDNSAKLSQKWLDYKQKASIRTNQRKHITETLIRNMNERYNEETQRYYERLVHELPEMEAMNRECSQLMDRVIFHLSALPKQLIVKFLEEETPENYWIVYPEFDKLICKIPRITCEVLIKLQDREMMETIPINLFYTAIFQHLNGFYRFQKFT
jgi:uncharacterized FlaG/YvyC family protein